MKDEGFTLIEILVVVLIVGLLAVTVALRGGSQHNESAKVVTDRLKSLLIYAEQQAILQPATLGFDYQPKKGYQFLIYHIDPISRKGSWDTQNSDSLLRLYTLPQKITLSVLPGETYPAIIFYPSGEITTFKINILEDEKVIYQITGDSNGTVQVIKNPPQ